MQDYNNGSDDTTVEEAVETKKGRKPTSQKWAEIHENAMETFGRIQSALRDERKQCLTDRRFYSIAGAQWEGPLGEQFKNKPRLELNKIRKSVTRIQSEYRNNRMDATFTAKDGAPSDELAETCAALQRSDEQDSSAEEAYDNCFEEGVGGGYGAWRYRAQYEDDELLEGDEDDRQRIRIEPIYDADSSVYFDLDAKKQDKSDARCCFVVTFMTFEEYERRFGEDPSTWPVIVHQYEYDWMTPAGVRVAEYYEVEMTKEVVHIYRSSLSGEEVRHTEAELEEEPELLKLLADTGFKEVKVQKRRRKRVHKYIMDGRQILEDEGYVAGTEIPIVPFYAMRWFVDNVERCAGHVRIAVDAQRIMNMMISVLAEIAASSKTEKPIVAPEQILAHKFMWEKDNIENFAYLLLDPITDAAGQPLNGPMAYTKSSSVPPAIAALIQFMGATLEEMLGNPEQAEKVVSHVASKTMDMIQQRIDANSLLYMQNMAKAKRRGAQIWLGMARELYREKGRKMKGLDLMNQASQITLNEPTVDPVTKQIMMANDLSKAKFDVNIEIGPSHESKRDAAVSAATNVLGVTQQDPETQNVLTNFILMNMKGEGTADIRKWARQRLLKAGAATPTPEEAKQLAQEAANAKPSPQDQYILAAAEEAKAKAQSTLVEMQRIAAQIDKLKADTIKTLADVDRERVEASVKTAESLHGMLTTPPQPPPGEAPSQ